MINLQEKMEKMFSNTKGIDVFKNPHFWKVKENLKAMGRLDRQYERQKKEGYIDCADEYYNNLWVHPDDYTNHKRMKEESRIMRLKTEGLI